MSVVESKQQALDLFEAHRRDYLVQARQVAKQIYRELKRPITAEDVRQRCPVPDHVNPSVLGALFNKADWQFVGYESAKRTEAHGRIIRTYRPRFTA